MNKGFAIYDNYWKAIENLSENEQKEVSYALMRYGMLGELPSDKNSITYSMIMAWKIAIDNSVERYNMAAVRGKCGGRPSNIDSEALTEMIKSGKKPKAIAEELGVSVSAIYKRPEWIHRND